MVAADVPGKLSELKTRIADFYKAVAERIDELERQIADSAAAHAALAAENDTLKALHDVDSKAKAELVTRLTELDEEIRKVIAGDATPPAPLS